MFWKLLVKFGWCWVKWAGFRVAGTRFCYVLVGILAYSLQGLIMFAELWSTKQWPKFGIELDS